MFLERMENSSLKNESVDKRMDFACYVELVAM
jgi:hypothetical protein